MLKLPSVALISHVSKAILKMLQARRQLFVKWELSDVQAGFRKGRGIRNKIANICWIMEKAWKFQKSIYFCFIDYTKAFYCVDHNKLRKILKETGIPDHLTCLLRNLYAGEEATVRTLHGIMDWFQIGKGVHQGCILSPCLFNNLYAEYIMQNASWITHKLKSRLSGETSITSNMQMTPLLWQIVKRNQRASWWWWKRKVQKLVKNSIQKTKIMASGLTTSWQRDGETMETVTDFIFLGSKMTVDGDCSHEIKRHLILWKKSNDKPRQCIKKKRNYCVDKGFSSQSYGFSSSQVDLRVGP